MQKRWALSVPLDGFTLAEHADVAREMEGLGYTDAWSLEVDGVDIFSPLAVVGQATGMRVGSAIANVFTRGPATLAMSAAGVAEIAPGRFCSAWDRARGPSSSFGTAVASSGRLPESARRSRSSGRRWPASG